MKTRTRQIGVDGLMSALFRNFRTPLLALAALGAAQTAQAATSQSFVWVGSAAAQSEWTTGSCWMYHNGSEWKTTTGNPG